MPSPSDPKGLACARLRGVRGPAGSPGVGTCANISRSACAPNCIWLGGARLSRQLPMAAAAQSRYLLEHFSSAAELMSKCSHNVLQAGAGAQGNRITASAPRGPGS